MTPTSGAETNLNAGAQLQTFPIRRHQTASKFERLHGDIVTTILTIQKRDGKQTENIDLLRPWRRATPEPTVLAMVIKEVRTIFALS